MNPKLAEIKPEGLVAHANFVGPEARLEDVQRKFLECGWAYLAVVSAGKAVGICSSVHIGGLMSSKFGYSLHARQEVKQHLQPNPLIVRKETPILELLHSDLTGGGKPFADDVLLVEADGRFIGLIPVEKIVKLQTRLLTENISEIAAARDAALGSTRLKSLFLANVSHELRTPMNGIIGMSALLLETTLTEDQMELARTVSRCSEDLLQILNDLLDFSKIEARKLRLEPTLFSVPDTIRESFEIAALRGKTRGLSMHCSDLGALPCKAVGDPGRIRQILANLLNNAIKFTERGSVSLHASHDQREAGACVLRLSVTDTGIGIPQSDQALLFQPFVQADGTSTRKHGGTGLGLAIVRELAELMGGEAGLNSEPGVGSTFWVRIVLQADRTEKPAERADAPPAAAAAAVEELMPLRILLAEDNPVNRSVAVRFLKKIGCETTLASNGIEALKAFQDSVFDAILMDCQMPEMDGYAATREIRSLEESRNSERCPILALTANTLPEDEARCRQAGMDAFLTKPLSLDRLRAALKSSTQMKPCEAANWDISGYSKNSHSPVTTAS